MFDLISTHTHRYATLIHYEVLPFASITDTRLSFIDGYFSRVTCLFDARGRLVMRVYALFIRLDTFVTFATLHDCALVAFGSRTDYNVSTTS
jgi:hypothetical protein